LLQVLVARGAESHGAPERGPERANAMTWRLRTLCQDLADVALALRSNCAAGTNSNSERKRSVLGTLAAEGPLGRRARSDDASASRGRGSGQPTAYNAGTGVPFETFRARNPWWVPFETKLTGEARPECFPLDTLDNCNDNADGRATSEAQCAPPLRDPLQSLEGVLHAAESRQRVTLRLPFHEPPEPQRLKPVQELSTTPPPAPAGPQPDHTPSQPLKRLRGRAVKAPLTKKAPCFLHKLSRPTTRYKKFNLKPTY